MSVMTAAQQQMKGKYYYCNSNRMRCFKNFASCNELESPTELFFFYLQYDEHSTLKYSIKI